MIGMPSRPGFRECQARLFRDGIDLRRFFQDAIFAELMLSVGLFCCGLDGFSEATRLFPGQAKILWAYDKDRRLLPALRGRVDESALKVGSVGGDVTQLQLSDLLPVDFVAAGAPCQPHSLLGHRLGDEDERSDASFTSATC